MQPLRPPHPFHEDGDAFQLNNAECDVEPSRPGVGQYRVALLRYRLEVSQYAEGSDRSAPQQLEMVRRFACRQPSLDKSKHLIDRAGPGLGRQIHAAGFKANSARC
jgi:hypothetical protein